MKIIFFALIALIVIWIIRFFKQDASTEISYNEFLTMIDEQKIEKVIIKSDTIEIKPIEEDKNVTSMFFTTGKPSLYTGKVEEDETLTKRLLDKGIEVEGEIPDNSAQVWYFIFSYVLPIVLFGAIAFLLFIIPPIPSELLSLLNNKNAIAPNKTIGRTYENIKYHTCAELSGISPSTSIPLSSNLCQDY